MGFGVYTGQHRARRARLKHQRRNQTNTPGNVVRGLCSPVARFKSLTEYSTLLQCGFVVNSKANLHVKTVPSSLTSSTEAIQPRMHLSGSLNPSLPRRGTTSPSGRERRATDIQSQPLPPLSHSTMLKKT